MTNESSSRALTPEEVTQRFLDHLHGLVEYWSELPDRSTAEKLDGLAFSILSMLDGCALDLPAFDIVARPHPDDKAFHASRNEPWFEDGTVLESWLHDRWYTQEGADA